MRLINCSLIVLFLIIINNACMLPYALMSVEPPEDMIAFEETKDAQVLQEELIESKSNSHPPLTIEAGEQNKLLFAGLTNRIKIHIEGASTRHLEVSANGQILEATDVDNGTYSFFSKHAGFVVEIVAKDLQTGHIVAKVFDLVNVPAPDAYVWKYRTVFRNQTKFTAEQFKMQNAIILQHNNIKVPVLCGPISYMIVRIDQDGNRYSHNNLGKRGQFDTETRKLVDAAKKDDIYIFKSIKSNCTQEEIKDIVYIMD
ncbi:MAG: hypothetical protein MK207_12745 [Saprospiraceae bacterium]|nr:hypothetical protein [Saprospiraceae bacterium]